MSAEVNGLPAVKPHAPAPRKGGRFNKLKPYLAPILITAILAVGDFNYRVLSSYWYTAAAILTAIVAETAFSLFVSGRLPHFASAYITGISVGIILQAPVAWPFIMCSLLSISSKYALRLKGRHIWNPSNLGVSLLLFIIPDWVAPLSQQWGNDTPVLLIIAALGCTILYTLGRLHITLTFVIAFAMLASVRSWMTDRPWAGEIALLTAPAFQLYMFFMITDPKTTTTTWRRQIFVTVMVAVADALIRMREDRIASHAPYYALFIVFPIANTIEIIWDGLHPKPAKPVAVPSVTAPPSQPAIVAAERPAS